LLVIAIAGEFAWPLTPLPILIAMTVWFAVLGMPRKASTVTA
jgi:hypothetical protein